MRTRLGVGCTLEQMLGICNMNLISLQHRNDKTSVTSLTYPRKVNTFSISITVQACAKDKKLLQKTFCALRDVRVTLPNIMVS